jgi:hypothetical protein
MAKMKKAVEKILEENQSAPSKKTTKKTNNDPSQLYTATLSVSDVAEMFRQKRAEVEEYQGRSRRLVETMRVPDLTYIPIRYLRPNATNRKS